MQEHRPIAYHKQALKGKHLHLSAYETKCLPWPLQLRNRGLTCWADPSL